MVDLSVLDNQYLAWGDLKDLFEGFSMTGGQMVGSVGGTASAITGNVDNPPTAYEDGMVVYLMPTSNVTGATTINLNGLGTSDIKRNIRGTLTDLGANEMLANRWYQLIYDSTAGDFQLMNPTPVHVDRVALSVGGTASAITVTTNEPAPAYYNGMSFVFKPNSASTGATTMNVDGLGAKDLEVFTAGSLGATIADTLQTGTFYKAIYDSTSDSIQLFDISRGTFYLKVENGSISHSGTGWNTIRTHTVTVPECMFMGVGGMNYSLAHSSTQLFQYTIQANFTGTAAGSWDSYIYNNKQATISSTDGFRIPAHSFMHGSVTTAGTLDFLERWRYDFTNTKYSATQYMQIAFFPSYHEVS